MMPNYTAVWEVRNEDREDFLETDLNYFNTIEGAKKWLGFRFDHPDYYCAVFDQCCHAVLTNYK